MKVQRNMMLKLGGALLIVFSFASCSNDVENTLPTNPIEGTWMLHTNFVDAEYEIRKEGDEFKGFVLNYNDGTTIYSHKEGEDKQCFLAHLTYDKGNYEGGKMHPNSPKPEDVQIELINDSTLNLTKTVMHRPVTETWTKK